MARNPKVEYTRPTSQLDLERRQKEEAEVAEKGGPDPLHVLVNPQPPTGEEPYIGVDSIYQNHANDTEAPSLSEEGPEQVEEERYIKSFEVSEAKQKLYNEAEAEAAKEAKAKEPVAEEPVTKSTPKEPVTKPATKSSVAEPDKF